MPAAASLQSIQAVLNQGLLGLTKVEEEPMTTTHLWMETVKQAITPQAFCTLL